MPYRASSPPPKEPPPWGLVRQHIDRQLLRMVLGILGGGVVTAMAWLVYASSRPDTTPNIALTVTMAGVGIIGVTIMVAHLVGPRCPCCRGVWLVSGPRVKSDHRCPHCDVTFP